MLQIGYEPERDRLTWDGWDIHCGQGLEVLLPDRLGGGTWRPVSFEYNAGGWYMPGQPGLSPVGLWAERVMDEFGRNETVSLTLWVLSRKERKKVEAYASTFFT